MNSNVYSYINFARLSQVVRVQILNYKGFYSVVLLVLVDTDYRFVGADVGTNGCCSDAQIFKIAS